MCLKKTFIAALALIRTAILPGLAVQTVSRDYIIPDVFVRKRHGRWSVDVNRSTARAPSTRLCDMVRGDSDHTTPKQPASGGALAGPQPEIRNDTLLKVAICIVDRQTSDHGESSCT